MDPQIGTLGIDDDRATSGNPASDGIAYACDFHELRPVLRRGLCGYDIFPDK